MAIAQVIAGAYAATFSRVYGEPLPLNYTRQGFNLNFTMKGERVEESDIYGLCFLDLVYRGYQLSIDMVCRVYSSTIIGAMFPWAEAALGYVYSVQQPIAQLASTNGGKMGGVLILTVVDDTPANVADLFDTVTANVIISADNNMQNVLNSTARDGPLKFDVLLQDSGGTGIYLTIT